MKIANVTNIKVLFRLLIIGNFLMLNIVPSKLIKRFFSSCELTKNVLAFRIKFFRYL